MTYLEAVVISVISFAYVYFLAPKFISFMKTNNMTVPDINKKDKPMIPRFGGALFAGGIGLAIGIVSLYSDIDVAIFRTTISVMVIAFVIGYIDDKKIMAGWFKPLALILASLPILFFGAYDTDLTIPLFGSVSIEILYLGLIILIIPIMGNTINSIDVMNGVASGFMTISGFALTIVLLILGNHEVAVISLALAFSSLALYKYHKFPSKTFLGDSGTLAMGAMYGTLVIMGGVEMLGAIIILPAILNSFLFLSSVKKIVEHRQIKSKPVEHTEDMKLKATDDPKAPVTLVRLILGSRILSEKQIAKQIFKLTFLSSGLAIFTALLMRFVF